MSESSEDALDSDMATVLALGGGSSLGMMSVVCGASLLTMASGVEFV